MDTTEKRYTILGREYAQRELTPLRLQRLAATEAWTVMQNAESSGLEIYMNPAQCADLFNSVLLPVVGGTPKPEQFATFTADDFKDITLSEVGEVFGHFCFFNRLLAQSLAGLTGLSQMLDALRLEAPAGTGLSTGNISAPLPAAGTLAN